MLYTQTLSARKGNFVFLAHYCTHLDPRISSPHCTQMQRDALPGFGFGGCHSWLFEHTKFTIADSCFRQNRRLLGAQFRVEIDRRATSSVGTHPLWAHMWNSTPLSPGSMVPSEVRHWTSVSWSLRASGSVSPEACPLEASSAPPTSLLLEMLCCVLSYRSTVLPSALTSAFCLPGLALFGTSSRLCRLGSFSFVRLATSFPLPVPCLVREREGATRSQIS